MRLALATLVAAGVVALPTAPTAATGAAPPHHLTPCSRGLVALTFDDGPSTAVTPRLVRVLQRLDVPATFFMVGSRIATAPDVARLVAEAGFTIGNHTWAHSDLTTQTPGEIRRSLRDTDRELRKVGIAPTRLVRPPYGAVDTDVRRVLARARYVPVLWTVDSRDWEGGSPARIVSTVLGGVRPHPADVIVLQHDGVTNSPATLRALPEEVRRLRARGYCFAALDDAGRPAPPVPVASVRAGPTVTEGGQVRVTVRLDRPTSRPTSVRVATRDVASGADDYGWTSAWVRFGVGERVARLRLPVLRDGLDESREDVALTLTGAGGVAASGPARALVTIIDRDGPPEVGITAGTVTASATNEVAAPVVVRLARPSGREVRVRVRTHRGAADDVRPLDAWVVVPPGARAARVPVSVLPGPVEERIETVRVDVVGVRHAVLSAARTATVTVRPATSPPAPARLRVPGGAWS